MLRLAAYEWVLTGASWCALAACGGRADSGAQGIESLGGAYSASTVVTVVGGQSNTTRPALGGTYGAGGTGTPAGGARATGGIGNIFSGTILIGVGGTACSLWYGGNTFTSLVSPALCGNGLVESANGEQCDDGNQMPGDGCSSNCQVEPYWNCPNPCAPCTMTIICGDGAIGPGEECDDGNVRSLDGCSDACQREPGWFCALPGKPCERLGTCGDGEVLLTEPCDLGEKNGTGVGCNKDCTVQAGFRCSPWGCTKLPVCGNGQVETGEQCDDGNALAFDGCSARCQIEAPLYTCVPGALCTVPATCGNGRLDDGEQCDPGGTSMVEALDAGSPCSLGCASNGRCGDGIVQAGEDCDLGAENNSGSYGGCSTSCTLNAYCGDGHVDSAFGEMCDDGINDGSYRCCTAACALAPYCGDGQAQPEEECDLGDANGHPGAPCNERCQVVAYCGNGQREYPEDCDDGVNDGSYGTCTADCRFAPYCGDGIKNGPEQCDEGGPTDRCTATCHWMLPVF